MKLWLIRHGIAEDRDLFEGDDLDRPLTDKGIRRLRKVFGRLAGIYDPPDRLVSSHAVRAWQTAELFCQAFSVHGFEKTERLNPGCSPRDMLSVLRDLPPGTESAALFGHEPDFSLAASEWTSGGRLNMVLKKGGLIELDLNMDGTADLVMSVPPKILAG